MVGLDHRVDVGGVQQRDTPRHALAGGQDQQAVSARPGQPFLADPGQGGQEVVLGEPVDVIGVAGQDRAVGRRPAHAGCAHVGTDDAVHQGRLPGTCGADQGYQHGRGGPADPGQQVVVDLAEKLGAFGLHLGRTVDLEHQRHGRDPLAQVEQSRLEQPRVHPHVGLGGRVGPPARPGGGRGRRRRGSGGWRGIARGERGSADILGAFGSADIVGALGRGGDGSRDHDVGRAGDTGRARDVGGTRCVARSLVADRIVIPCSVTRAIRIAHVIRLVGFGRLVRLICQRRPRRRDLGGLGLVFFQVRLRLLRRGRLR